MEPWRLHVSIKKVCGFTFNFLSLFGYLDSFPVFLYDGLDLLFIFGLEVILARVDPSLALHD